MSGTRVHAATEPERASVIDILMLAFASDPLGRTFWPNATTHIGAFPPLAAAFGGAAFAAGTAFVTDDAAAAALWLPPGFEPDGDTLAAILADTVEKDTGIGAAQVFAEMAEYHPHEPHWYLPLIGVDPAFQGRGLGSALLKHALQRCDAAGLPAYLESSNPRNVALYERHGFEVMGLIQPDGFPPVHPMLRPARA